MLTCDVCKREVLFDRAQDGHFPIRIIADTPGRKYLLDGVLGSFDLCGNCGGSEKVHQALVAHIRRSLSAFLAMSPEQRQSLTEEFLEEQRLEIEVIR